MMLGPTHVVVLQALRTAVAIHVCALYFYGLLQLVSLFGQALFLESLTRFFSAK